MVIFMEKLDVLNRKKQQEIVIMSFRNVKLTTRLKTKRSECGSFQKLRIKVK